VSHRGIEDVKAPSDVRIHCAFKKRDFSMISLAQVGTQTITVCRVCEKEGYNAIHTAQELAYGMTGAFDYSECSSCGCIQICDVPPDLARYYPREYYSFAPPFQPRLLEALKAAIRRQRSRYYLKQRSLLGGALARWTKGAALPEWEWFLRTKTGVGSRILDVGCGTGDRPSNLSRNGFRRVEGVDVFIDRSYQLGPVKITKGSLSDLEGSFDLVMLHHSLEHMPDQRQSLAEVYRLVRPGGYALLRIPIVGQLWSDYGVYWCGLDAPRHLFIHSVRSITDLAMRTGFEVSRIEHETHAIDIEFSKEYRAGIPMCDSPHMKGGRMSFLSENEERECESLARQMDEAERGDQACFYLLKH
jgi:SAM-dependent methyltransferase